MFIQLLAVYRGPGVEVSAFSLVYLFTDMTFYLFLSTLNVYVVANIFVCICKVCLCVIVHVIDGTMSSCCLWGVQVCMRRCCCLLLFNICLLYVSR